jgi:hypothetical protein
VLVLTKNASYDVSYEIQHDQGGRAMSGQVDPYLIKHLDFISINLLPKGATFQLCFQITINILKKN